jgi:cell division septum initiation protein DivIVA
MEADDNNSGGSMSSARLEYLENIEKEYEKLLTKHSLLEEETDLRMSFIFYSDSISFSV